MTEEQAIQKGRRAAHELTETQWAFDEMKALLVEKLIATGVDAVASREKYYDALKAIEMVRKVLVETMANGQALTYQRDMAALLSPADQDRR